MPTASALATEETRLRGKPRELEKSVGDKAKDSEDLYYFPEEKKRQLMAPSLVKHEHEIADALDKWSEALETLRAHGEKYEFSAPYKVAVLGRLMECKEKQFEILVKEALSRHNGRTIFEFEDAMFDDLYSEVRVYAWHCSGGRPEE